MIRAVYLDIDDTLLSFDAYVREGMKEGFAHFGLPPYREEMFATFTKINTGLWRSLEREEITFEELKRVRFALVFRELGIDFDGVTFESYFRSRLNDSAIPVPGARELLDALAENYRLYAASNGPYHQQMHRLELAGFLPYFSQCFISEEIGASKPSPEYFAACLARTRRDLPDVCPDEIAMVGDSLTSDMAGARGAGMKTVYYNWRNRTPTDLLDAVVRTLADVPEVLRNL